MNIIPLHPIPSEGRNPKTRPTLLVNMDLIISVEKMIWHPQTGEDAEGCRLFGINSHHDSTLIFEVRETQMEILRLLEGPGKLSVCQCKCSTIQNPNPRDCFP